MTTVSNYGKRGFPLLSNFSKFPFEKYLATIVVRQVLVFLVSEGPKTVCRPCINQCPVCPTHPAQQSVNSLSSRISDINNNSTEDVFPVDILSYNCDVGRVTFRQYSLLL